MILQLAPCNFFVSFSWGCNKNHITSRTGHQSFCSFESIDTYWRYLIRIDDVFRTHQQCRSIEELVRFVSHGLIRLGVQDFIHNFPTSDKHLKDNLHKYRKQGWFESGE